MAAATASRPKEPVVTPRPPRRARLLTTCAVLAAGLALTGKTIKTPPVKKRIGNIINMNTNAKVKENKGYEYWATKRSRAHV